jgi:hypothetical protein
MNYESILNSGYMAASLAAFMAGCQGSDWPTGQPPDG